MPPQDASPFERSAGRSPHTSNRFSLDLRSPGHDVEMHDAAGGVDKVSIHNGHDRLDFPFFPGHDEWSRQASEGLAARFLCGMASRRVSHGLGDEVAAGASVFLAGRWTTDYLDRGPIRPRVSIGTQ